MGRIMAIDFGTKRTGIAVTDPLQMIANGLTTVRTHELFDFLAKYLAEEAVEHMVVGAPKRMDNTASEVESHIAGFVRKVQKQFPEITISRMDERFTSKLAFQSMLDGGLKKKARQNKALVDQVSATLILQSYLEAKNAGF